MALLHTLCIKMMNDSKMSQQRQENVQPVKRKELMFFTWLWNLDQRSASVAPLLTAGPPTMSAHWGNLAGVAPPLIRGLTTGIARLTRTTKTESKFLRPLWSSAVLCSSMCYYIMILCSSTNHTFLYTYITQLVSWSIVLALVNFSLRRTWSKNSWHSSNAFMLVKNVLN